MDASLTQPMSSNSPSRWYWPRWLGLYWGATKAFGWLAERSGPAGWVLNRTVLSTNETLTKLSFIDFARWSVVRGVPASSDGGEMDEFPYGYLLFETNFNGDADLYFEAFSMATTNAMMFIWQRCYDVPWIRRTGRFIDFINEKKLPIDTLHCTYCAYPHATAKVIRQAIELQREVDEFQARAPRDPREFQRAYGALLTRVQTLADPRPPEPRGLRRLWHKPVTGETGMLSVLTPVDPSRRDALEGEMSELDASALGLPKTHLARWVRIERLDVPNRLRDRPRPEGSYLLFSIWFDGGADEFLPLLYRALHDHGVGTRLWECCGFVDTGQPDDFGSYLLRHSVDLGISFAAYDGYTVEQVKRALGIYHDFYEFAVESQGFDAPDLQSRWRALRIGGRHGDGR